MKIFGILNITEDSFSDGNRFLAPDAAIAHAKALLRDGSDVLDIGGASSNPDAKAVPPAEEIARLAPVLDALRQEGASVSVDSFAPEVQRWALTQAVDYLNDIHGFAEPLLYPALAVARCKLVVMHAVQARGRASRVDIPPAEIFGRCIAFLDQRIAALTEAGVDRDRLILDPGMGFFLGSDPQASFEMLRRLGELKDRCGLPVLVSVSRKSFLRRLTGRGPREAGAASLAAELFAVLQGADYIRTHEPAPLKDACAVWQALAPETHRNPA